MNSGREKPCRIGLSLGSNLGDRFRNLKMGKEKISCLKVNGSPLLQSSIVESAPVDCPVNSENFFNLALEILFLGNPFLFFEKTQEIEKEMGRKNSLIQNSPRVLDIDILYIGERKVNSETLICPHPEAHKRLFVIQPLNEIRPLLRNLNSSKTVNELYTEFIKNESPLNSVYSRHVY